MKKIKICEFSPDDLLLDCIKEMTEYAKINSTYSLGVVLKNGKLLGSISDGDIRRFSEKKGNLDNLKVKNVMTKNPISVDKEMLAAKALSLMSARRITSLCVHKNKAKSRTVGIIHIHNILENNIQ